MMTHRNADGRQPAVAIYNAATGTTLLRGWHPGSIEDLQFSTGMPGGFLEASFALRTPAPKYWPVDTGQKVIIRWGRKIVWWGWVEDVRRKQWGRTEELEVLCLGPWQTLSQRLIPSIAYTSPYDGAQAIRAELAAYGTYISADYSQIQDTHVDIAPLTQSYQSMDALVKLICDGGNAAGKPMLFALWEPTGMLSLIGSSGIVINPGFEYGSSTDAAYWTEPSGGVRSTTQVLSGLYSMALLVAHTRVSTVEVTDLVSVAGSTAYQTQFSVYFPAAANLSAYIKIDWYTSVAYISTSTGTIRASTGTAGWTTWTEIITSPASAELARVKVTVANSSGGTVTMYVDDAQVWLAGTALSTDQLPRAFLWPRDLTGYDYLLHTGRLASGVDITESTRQLANAVLASYGSSSYTSFAEDGASQAAYRRRDHVVAAGSDASAALAGSMRDTYLAAYKNPRDEPGSFVVRGPGAITTLYGAPVDLPLIRAGDRLRIADGAYTGRIVMINSTRWSANGLQITPERELSAGELLARV